ncbi:ABC transporter ATP-binding protein [Anaerobacillus sp. MEB173]|uniref:ABC transporter ATP-binding protein n=1 Tax=Anaerobacillus sp. MEB173 TaxID=3383345 RepID=UPI003F8FD972
MIEVKDLCKQFKDGEKMIDVLKKISFTINEGDFVSIVGASGSGKSTLLTIIGGLQEPTSGHVYFKGQDIFADSKEDLAIFRQKHIGFVFQQMHLIPYLTALENVLLPLVPLNMSIEEQLERGRWALEKVGLKGKENRYPDQLSGGEQGRVALARAIVNKPPLILADEPTGNLDSKTGKTIMDLFKELNNEGQTILFITHHPEHANYGNRVFDMQDGLIVESR